MKPISLEFQAFGPYAGKENINFEELSANGLFLICGETGSGKTMMLDAMTFALYGKSSGHGRDDFVAMRCTNADSSVPTYVKFVFENNKDYYLFERRLEMKRTKFSASYNLMKKDADGIWRTLLENPKDKDLNAKAVELIGLEYDQFRQVIVLPQGQFERLLTSKSDEKEKILTSIFGEEKWQLIADKFFENCKERADALKGKKDKIYNSLAEEDCETISDLVLLVQHKENEYQRIDEEIKDANYDEKIKALQEDKALVARFGDLHKAENRKNELEESKQEREDEEKALKLAQKAEKVRGCIDGLVSCELILGERQKELDAAIAGELKAKEKAESSEKRLAEHLAKKKDIEEKKEQKTRYSSKEDDYANVQKSEENCTELKKAYEKTDKEHKKALKDLEEANANVEMVETNCTQLLKEYTEMFSEYIHGISGELAEQLGDGIPCPVCGSTSHPAPAVKAPNSVTKKDIDKKDQEVKTGQKHLEDCKAVKASAESKESRCKTALADAKTNMEVAKEAHKQLLQGLFEGINDLDALKKEIGNLENEIAQYEKVLEQLKTEKESDRERHTQAKTRIDSAQTELKAAKDNKDKAENALSKSIKENGFASKDEVLANLLSLEEINRLQKDIAEYDAEVESNLKTIKEISSELKDKVEPDKEALERLILETTADKEAKISQQANINTEKNRLSTKLENLEKEGKDIEKDIEEAESDLRFAKSLRGDTGTGLQRYVLGIMFSSVVSAANKMLELVHGGRYRLFRTDDKTQGGNKAGLELKVYDKYSDDQDGRFVNTLSGGEKFLVSLALSIGMSTVAQKSGIKIEALFIDEGFGSLDENSIVDAMNILNSIQQANGLVGIISHVQLLRDRIPTKLIVSKSEGKSHIKESIG